MMWTTVYIIALAILVALRLTGARGRKPARAKLAQIQAVQREVAGYTALNQGTKRKE